MHVLFADDFPSSSESPFSISLTHTLASTASTLNATQNTVDIARAAPLLMCEYIATKFAFAALNQVHISKHAVCFEALCKLIGNGSGAVQTG